MKLSIIIPARNEEHMLLETLRSIPSLTIDYEVIVVDNNSTDATAEIARMAGARVSFTSKQTAAAARNAGAPMATGEWLLFLDADASVSPQLLTEALVAMRSNKYDAGSCLIRGVGSANMGHQLWNTVALRRKRLCGAFLFIRRAVFNQIGGFDAEVEYGEERGLTDKVKPGRRFICHATVFLRPRNQALMGR